MIATSGNSFERSCAGARALIVARRGRRRRRGRRCAPRPRAANTPGQMETAIRRVIGEAEIRKGKVTLDLPPLVENGNTVPMTVTVDRPMTKADHVKAIHVFNEKNPQANVVEHAARAARRKGARVRRASASPARRR